MREAERLLAQAKRTRLRVGRQEVPDPYARRRWAEPEPKPLDIVEQARAALARGEGE
jgi:hypothetical protein